MRSFVILASVVLAVRACAAVEVGLPRPVVPDGLGVNIHFTGKQEAQVKKISEAGFKFIRMDMKWQRTEMKRGEYDFVPYDELFGSLAKHGIRPLMIFDYGNPLYDDGLAPHTDEGRAAFGRFVEASAARYKGKGIIWEIWNEPNHPTFWKPYPNPEDYAKLAEVVYRSVKKSDPHAPVVGPALSSWDFSFLESLFKLGLLKHLDAVSVHPYGCAKPEDASEYYEKVRALIKKYAVGGRSVPVLSGEWGYASAKGFTRERQAQFVAREFLVNLVNRIPLSIWYDWHDDGPDPNDPEHNCGVIDYTYVAKPSYIAFQTLAKELDGFSLAARIDAGSDDDYLALFTKGDAVALAAWTTTAKHSIKTPVDVDGFQITSWDGNRSEVQANKGKLELELTGSPVYVTPQKPSRRWQLEAGWSVSASTAAGKSGLGLRIESSIGAPAPDYQFSIGHNRLRTKRTVSEASDAGGSAAVFSAPYVSNGEPKNRLRVVAKVLGLSEPLTRNLDFENSACPLVRVLPPTDDSLLIEVNQPEHGKAPAFEGRLIVANYQGIRLVEDTASVRLNPGADRQMVRLKMTHKPAGIYSFACRLVDKGGRDFAKVPTRRYTLLESFAGGRPGEPVSGFGTELGGDAKALGEASLTYTGAPKGAPTGVCAQLDYRFDAGWKYVQIVPKSPLKIPERPQLVRLWIKGQGNSLPAHLRYVGADGQHFQQAYGRLETWDWRVLEGDISGSGITFWGAAADGIVRYPLSWNSLLLVDNPSKLATEGTIYVGPVMICYD